MKCVMMMAASIGWLVSAEAERQVDQFRLSGVALRPEKYKGVASIRLTMPSHSYQDPRKEALADRNFMAWLPMDFGNGIVEADIASDLAPNAPSYARGFVGFAFRIDDAGRFENIYLRPTNSVSTDPVRRSHTIQYAAYPDFRFDALRRDFPGKYEAYADVSTGRWIHLKLVVEGARAQLYIDNRTRPAFVVEEMKLPATQRGGVGIWIESGTVAHFRNLRVTPLPT